MKKILIIRFSSIGDIVLTTPVIRCIALQYPDMEIHYLTRSAFAGMLRANPYVRKVIAFDRELSAAISELKNEKYDLVIDLHHNLRSARVRLALGVKSCAFPKLNIEKWMLVNLKLNRLPNLHIVDRYFQAVRIPGLKNDGSGLDYFIPSSDEVELSSLPDPFSKGFIAMAIGAQHATKRMPVSKIDELVGKMGLPIVLLGGKDDYESGELIRSQHPELIYNACEKFNLNQSASLVRQSKLVITHDTGLMHIAAAFHKRIISVWGNTVPAFGMTPYLPSGKGESVMVQVEGLSCRPCSKIGFAECPKTHFSCMKEIDTSIISEQVNRWWI